MYMPTAWFEPARTCYRKQIITSSDTNKQQYCTLDFESFEYFWCFFGSSLSLSLSLILIFKIGPVTHIYVPGFIRYTTHCKILLYVLRTVNTYTILFYADFYVLYLLFIKSQTWTAIHCGC